MRFTVLNLSNQTALYNFLSPLGGTHWVQPRFFQAQLGWLSDFESRPAMSALDALSPAKRSCPSASPSFPRDSAVLSLADGARLITAFGGRLRILAAPSVSGWPLSLAHSPSRRRRSLRDERNKSGGRCLPGNTALVSSVLG